MNICENMEKQVSIIDIYGQFWQPYLCACYGTAKVGELVLYKKKIYGFTKFDHRRINGEKVARIFDDYYTPILSAMEYKGIIYTPSLEREPEIEESLEDILFEEEYVDGIGWVKVENTYEKQIAKNDAERPPLFLVRKDVDVILNGESKNVTVEIDNESSLCDLTEPVELFEERSKYGIRVFTKKKSSISKVHSVLTESEFNKYYGDKKLEIVELLK